MQTRIEVKPIIYEWLINRSQIPRDELFEKHPQLEHWITGEKQPTLKQLEDFANRVHAPIGFFFLSEPMEETLPIADFRTFANNENYRQPPSPNLLEAIYQCQERQDWYENYCRITGENKIDFIGSETTNSNPYEVAAKIRNNFSLHQNYSSIDDAFSKRRDELEDKGILVAVSGFVKRNTQRTLNLEEFRGFAISNEYAPIIFINATDSNAGRNFTLIHELAHLWLGSSGLSNGNYSHKIERWCNAVAAEVLVPHESLRQQYNVDVNLNYEISRLAKYYKVSTLVVLLRLKNTQLINLSEEEFHIIYYAESQRLRSLFENKPKGRGGNYYNTKPSSIGKRFLKALATSTLEGHTLYRDALRLTDVRKMHTFNNLTKEILGG